MLGIYFEIKTFLVYLSELLKLYEYEINLRKNILRNITYLRSKTC